MTPRLLFVPVSSAGGAGEYMRSLIIARAVRARWPEAHVHFVLNAAAGYGRDMEFPSTMIQGSPTYNVPAVNEVITRERPHVVIFDSSGRVAQYKHARSNGAAVVYVSSRPKTRWKGFRLRRMRYIDQHWLAQPRFLDAELTRWERMKLGLLRGVEVVFLDPVFEPPDDLRQERLLESLGLQAQQYVLMCIGSGGQYARVSDATRTLMQAAERIHRTMGVTCVFVSGANAPTAGVGAGVLRVSSLPNGELMDLLTAAKLAVINGGSLLLQAIANRVPAVAVPIAGDQAERIRRCAALQLVSAATLDVESIERSAVELLRNPEALSRLQQTQRSVNLENGVVKAVASLERLLQAQDTR